MWRTFVLFCFVFCLSFLSYSFIEIFPEKIIKKLSVLFFLCAEAYDIKMTL